ncbi:MAG: helix-turn-helix domain-containing protein [Planctomycetota bacterium]|jgi:transcriptional regulator with XRE-family HTH domain
MNHESEESLFGSSLRQLREMAGLSLRALALAVEMDPAYLSRIETGKTKRPTRATVERLASALTSSGMVSEKSRIMLLQQAGYSPQDPEGKVEELHEGLRFRLREAGISADRLDDVISRLDLPTLLRILRGEEELEEALAGRFSPSEIRRLRRAGEEAAERGFPMVPESPGAEPGAPPSASEYLRAHARSFRPQGPPGKRPQRAFEPWVIEAGPWAEIRGRGLLGSAQMQQLKTIARLIESILKGSAE